MILAGPFDTIYHYNVRKGLEDLLKNYDKNNVMKYLKKNLEFQNLKNVDNLAEIQDKEFWDQTIPKMIKLILKQADKQVCSCIRTLVAKSSLVSLLTRQQVLILLASMFFGIMPQSPFNNVRSFGHFMNVYEKDKKKQLKLQKLKFIINYFKIAIKFNQQTLQQMITYQKVCVKDQWRIQNVLDVNNQFRNIPLVNVKFSDQNSLIQDYYGKAAMVDFANKQIGGGVLKNGSVQQEILFLIFPQAITSMLLTSTMKDDQAIIIYGCRRFSKYKNYSHDLKFDGTYKDKLELINNSILIAIDATDFTQKMSAQVQFNKDLTLRQITKALVGFKQLQYAQIKIQICTGRWGCGAFKGDQVWKFFIQWIACSQADRQMIYLTDNEKLKKQLRITVKNLIKNNKSTLDLLSLMQNYARKRKNNNLKQKLDFLKYLKCHI